MSISPKTTKRKPIAEKTQRELEKTLDRIFSEYIRLRDADDNGWVRCITCGRAYPWKGTRNLHDGHFISRKVKATRYNEMNNHGQCESCNDFNHGVNHVYRLYLVNRYGKEAVEQLEYEAMLGGSYDRFWLQQKITEYREKVRRLKAEKGLR
jgi:hypothetical protein